MKKKTESKMCLVDEAENVIFELIPHRYGYIIPEEYAGEHFILNEGDVHKVQPVEFDIE